ncbi:MAG TPA: FAD-dependent oxidoreductase, partial [Candidatus Limnocylindrales bacterium]|nr:FAD-dependent oxidoreductase [Candidatus Limnocylindrales bacterium]
MSRPEILVIGAGVVGACVAYRLAEAGARVTVLDAAMPGTGTSSTSFAWINSFGKVPREYHDLNVAGMAEHERLARELSGPWLHRVGNLEWEEEAGQQARLRATVARLRGWDYAVEMIRPVQALELEPGLSISPAVEEVAFAPRDGYVEVVPLIGALLAAAGRLGARVLTGRRV